MKYLIAAYAVVGLLTFGYSYNADYRQGTAFARAEEINASAALMAGMCWPFYWTVKAFKPLRERDGQ